MHNKAVLATLKRDGVADLKQHRAVAQARYEALAAELDLHHDAVNDHMESLAYEQDEYGREKRIEARRFQVEVAIDQLPPEGMTVHDWVGAVAQEALEENGFTLHRGPQYHPDRIASVYWPVGDGVALNKDDLKGLNCQQKLDLQERVDGINRLGSFIMHVELHPYDPNVERCAELLGTVDGATHIAIAYPDNLRDGFAEQEDAAIAILGNMLPDGGDDGDGEPVPLYQQIASMA